MSGPVSVQRRSIAPSNRIWQSQTLCAWPIEICWGRLSEQWWHILKKRRLLRLGARSLSMCRRRSGMMCWHWLLRSCGGCTQAFWRDTACALLNLQHGKTTKLENNGVADDYRSEYECLFIMIV